MEEYIEVSAKTKEEAIMNAAIQLLSLIHI